MTLGKSSYEKEAQKMSEKHQKWAGVYLCPHCDKHHLTTKIEKIEEYNHLVYSVKQY